MACTFHTHPVPSIVLHSIYNLVVDYNHTYLHWNFHSPLIVKINSCNYRYGSELTKLGNDNEQKNIYCLSLDPTRGRDV